MSDSPKIKLDHCPWHDLAGADEVMAALKSDGGQARYVGGAVRDAVLGRAIKDVDIATPLTPEAVMERLKVARIKSIPTGIDHGTVTAVCRGHAYEITTLRHDVETDGRRAKVAFTQDWKADAARRDFTMNALYADEDGTVYDYFDGVEDARKGHIRFIGQPLERIQEDALRILRFFRFHATYGKGAPDEEGLKACVERRLSLKGLSRERIRDELFRLLSAHDPIPVFELMLENGILEGVVPEERNLEALKHLVALERAYGFADPLRRTVALLPADINTVWDVCKRLKLSNKDTKRAKAMVDGDITVSPDMNEKQNKAALYYLGADVFRDRLFLSGRAGENLTPQLELARSWRPPHLPINGRDILNHKLAEGPDVGACLRRLETLWVESGFSLSRDQLLEEAKRG